MYKYDEYDHAMVAARVASSIAAEIGTMKVTEQIDALTTLSTDPMKYLTVPRVVANITSRLAQLSSSSGSGMIEVIRSPCSSGSRSTGRARPRC